MPFILNFSPLSNSPPPAQALWGNAQFQRVKYVSSQPDMAYTNRLDVFINLPARASDAWIWEQEADGSVTPVAELTNQYNESPDQIFIQQYLLLTTNQVHQLILGNWYASVDFGDSNYWAKIDPQYANALGPWPFPYVYGVHDFLENESTAISINNHDAPVIFDTSRTIDPYYLPIIQCVWTAQAPGSPVIVTFTNLVATNVFNVGYYSGFVQLNDGLAEINYAIQFGFVVITAGQAVDWISSNLPPNIPQRNRQAMLNALSKAADCFNQGRNAAGCAQLRIYQRLVVTSHLDSTLTATMLVPPQKIIDAFK